VPQPKIKRKKKRKRKVKQTRNVLKMHDTNKMMISSIESVYVVLERKHLKDFLFV